MGAWRVCGDRSARRVSLAGVDGSGTRSISIDRVKGKEHSSAAGVVANPTNGRAAGTLLRLKRFWLGNVLPDGLDDISRQQPGEQGESREQQGFSRRCEHQTAPRGAYLGIEQQRTAINVHWAMAGACLA